MYENQTTTNEFVDITLACRDCGDEFIFTAGDQSFYAEKGFTNQPKCCKACRDAKKRNGNSRGQNRQFFSAVCGECGGEAKLSFQPTNDRPVYCSSCFETKKSAR